MKKLRFFDDPYLRFFDEPREQETFFIEDPSKNVIEIKTMKNPETLFQVINVIYTLVFIFP